VPFGPALSNYAARFPEINRRRVRFGRDGGDGCGASSNRRAKEPAEPQGPALPAESETCDPALDAGRSLPGGPLRLQAALEERGRQPGSFQVELKHRAFREICAPDAACSRVQTGR